MLTKNTEDKQMMQMLPHNWNLVHSEAVIIKDIETMLQNNDSGYNPIKL